jgi:hypothetical protein
VVPLLDRCSGYQRSAGVSIVSGRVYEGSDQVDVVAVAASCVPVDAVQDVCPVLQILHVTAKLG